MENREMWMRCRSRHEASLLRETKSDSIKL